MASCSPSKTQDTPTVSTVNDPLYPQLTQILDLVHRLPECLPQKGQLLVVIKSALDWHVDCIVTPSPSSSHSSRSSLLSSSDSISSSPSSSDSSFDATSSSSPASSSPSSSHSHSRSMATSRCPTQACRQPMALPTAPPQDSASASVQSGSEARSNGKGSEEKGSSSLGKKEKEEEKIKENGHATSSYTSSLSSRTLALSSGPAISFSPPGDASASLPSLSTTTAAPGPHSVASSLPSPPESISPHHTTRSAPPSASSDVSPATLVSVEAVHTDTGEASADMVNPESTVTQSHQSQRRKRTRQTRRAPATDTTSASAVSKERTARVCASVSESATAASSVVAQEEAGRNGEGSEDGHNGERAREEKRGRRKKRRVEGKEEEKEEKEEKEVPATKSDESESVPSVGEAQNGGQTGRVRGSGGKDTDTERDRWNRLRPGFVNAMNDWLKHSGKVLFTPDVPNASIMAPVSALLDSFTSHVKLAANSSDGFNSFTADDVALVNRRHFLQLMTVVAGNMRRVDSVVREYHGQRVKDIFYVGVDVKQEASEDCEYDTKA